MFRISRYFRTAGIAVLLVLTLLFTSCFHWFDFSRYSYAQIPFYQLDYTRPSYEELRTLADSVLEIFSEDSPSFSRVVKELDAFFTAMMNFNTMSSLANIRYAANTQSEIYLDETNYFTTHAILVEKCREEIMIAAAASSLREKLEKQYFGISLSDYVDYARYTNPDYFALSEKEAALIEKYRVTYSNAEVEGKPVWKTLENTVNAKEYNRILSLFYETYMFQIAGIYGDLIEVRREMASILGIDHYLMLSGDGLGRTFTIEEMENYLDSVSAVISEIDANYYNEYASKIDRTSDEYEMYTLLKHLCCTLDETGIMDQDHFFENQYSFMRSYALSDFSDSPAKENASFTTYLYDAAVPYILINPSGLLTDYTTVLHEFGHFVEMNYTMNSITSVDLAEVYSTGLELIAMHYLNQSDSLLSEDEIEDFVDYERQSVLQTLRIQGLLAEFELSLFSPDSTLNTSDAYSIFELFATLANKWGYQINKNNPLAAATWITIPHIFQYPSYVFSYCVSTDIAMQLSNLEREEDGKGLAAYRDLLNHTGREDDFLSVIQGAGLESPFVSDHFEKVLDAFLNQKSQDPAVSSAA